MPDFLKCARLVYLSPFFLIPSLYISRFLSVDPEMAITRPVGDSVKRDILRAAARRRGLYTQGDSPQAVYDESGYLVVEKLWHSFLDSLSRDWMIIAFVSFLFIKYGVSSEGACK